MIIYKIFNLINGKIYIGQTSKDVSLRIAEHIYGKYLLGKALRKYGIESFSISVIDSAETQEAINEKEKYWISFYGCRVPNGYNLTDGGEGVLGFYPTEEIKNKIRGSTLGNKNHFYGKRHSLESLQKMSKSKKGQGKGKKHTEETKGKIRVAHIGMKCSDEAKKKISKAKKGNKYTLGLKHTAETRIKMSESAKHRKRI